MSDKGMSASTGERENMGDGQTQAFVRASERESDPVGRIGDDWGFYDETWIDWHGGFADETAARAGCAAYAATL